MKERRRVAGKGCRYNLLIGVELSAYKVTGVGLNTTVPSSATVAGWALMASDGSADD
jgi:hypothetical protein